MNNKIRTSINPISGNEFNYVAQNETILTYQKFGHISMVVIGGETRRKVNANKMSLRQILGINQAGERIQQISNALIVQNDPQGQLIAGKQDKIKKFVNDIVYNTFAHTVNNLLDAGFSRTQAVNKGLEVAFKMTRSQYEKVYNVIDPDRFPDKQMMIDFKSTLQLGNLRQAIAYFQ